MEGVWRVSRRLWVVALAAAVFGVAGAAYAGEGWLGVMLQPLSDEIGEAMNLEKGITGVLVSDVVEGSPADAAGVEKGDVIVEIDGAAVAGVEGAVGKVKDLDPGSTVKMVVVREGKKEVLTAVLGDRADMPEKSGGTFMRKIAGKAEGDYDEDDDEDYYDLRIPRVERIFKEIHLGQGGYIGVEIRDISADLGSYFGVGCCEGVLVLEVVEDSPAEKAGLKAGDVIIKADGEDVHRSDGFADYVRGHEPGDKLDITFKRSKETRRVTVEVGENDSARIFLNRGGEPDVFRMCCEPGDLREKCIQMGDKCLMLGHECKMLGEECAHKCKMMMGDARDEKCKMKCKMMMGDARDEKCKMMMVKDWEGKAMDAGQGHPELQRPSPDQIKIIRSTESAEADLRAEIDRLKKDIEHLRHDMEALRKP